MTNATTTEYLPAETRVLNTKDGEPGSVLNGYASSAAGEWTEYEVVTEHGIEVWPRADFVLMTEIEADANDAD